jgi:hypothetical protein
LLNVTVLPLSVRTLTWPLILILFVWVP